MELHVAVGGGDLMVIDMPTKTVQSSYVVSQPKQATFILTQRLTSNVTHSKGYSLQVLVVSLKSFFPLSTF